MVAKECCFNQPGLQESNDHLQDFDNEADETLSLSDLVESSNCNNNDFEYQSASDHHDQDFFEFFTEDFTASSTSAYPRDSIIFCGKLIRYKEPTASSKAQQQDKSIYSYNALSQRKGYDVSVKEASTNSVKPRWYLLAFGHGRFPSEMKLRDIKNRLSRRIPARMFGSNGGGQMVHSNEKRSAWKGFWALLKVLGCKSQQANAVAKASFEGIRHV